MQLTFSEGEGPERIGGKVAAGNNGMLLTVHSDTTKNKGGTMNSMYEVRVWFRIGQRDFGKLEEFRFPNLEEAELFLENLRNNPKVSEINAGWQK
jgi:hypothetical protein